MPASTTLIIDDDLDMSDALATVLSDEGYRMVRAVPGEEGLHDLRSEEPPDLTLLDRMMPVMDGYRFLAERRQDPALADIPVLVLTAGVLDARALRLGAADCLRKPISLDTLLDVVQRYC